MNLTLGHEGWVADATPLFNAEIGHGRRLGKCPLSANSGHSRNVGIVTKSQKDLNGSGHEAFSKFQAKKPIKEKPFYEAYCNNC